MKNLNEMTINEIKNLVSELYSEKKAKEILSLSMDEVISILESEEETIIDTDDSTYNKHAPSRKKKSNRTKKAAVKYKKSKDKKWIEKRRTTVECEDITNRSFLNKVTKRYNKLYPHVKPKAKK